MTRPDLLEPYTTRICLPEPTVDAPVSLIAGLLEDVARRCEEAGSSLIGHIKCYVEAGDDRFRCNLTSIRHGARCERTPLLEAAEPPQGSGAPLRIDLAVLAYGLEWETIAGIVSRAVRERFGDATWSSSS